MIGLENMPNCFGRKTARTEGGNKLSGLDTSFGNVKSLNAEAF